MFDVLGNGLTTIPEGGLVVTSGGVSVTGSLTATNLGATVTSGMSVVDSAAATQTLFVKNTNGAFTGTTINGTLAGYSVGMRRGAVLLVITLWTRVLAMSGDTSRSVGSGSSFNLLTLAAGGTTLFQVGVELRCGTSCFQRPCDMIRACGCVHVRQVKGSGQTTLSASSAGLRVTAGGATVSAGGVVVTAGSAAVSGGLRVDNGGATITVRAA
jgi:hypothetical protein